MPVLSNPKHERFAQELAKGTGQAEAYVRAGYAPSEPHASRLASSGKVDARVAELLERAATRVEISVASITARLMKLADDAEKDADAANRSVARASLMDAAKLNGLVIEKAQVDQTVRNVGELSDDLLAHIAVDGSEGTAAPASRAH